jgi:hypothetical protein
MRRDGAGAEARRPRAAWQQMQRLLTMTMRTRKLVGAILLLLFLAAYSLVAMLVAVVLQVNSSKVAELAYYVVAGLLWVVPAAWLVKWMQKPDAPRQ